jgi:hypothetical protein
VKATAADGAHSAQWAALPKFAHFFLVVFHCLRKMKRVACGKGTVRIKSGRKTSAMQECNPMRHFEKITRVYSERREQQIAVRIHYGVSADSGSKVIELKQVQEFSL